MSVFQFFDKYAVGKPLEFDGLRDTADPQLSKITFFLFASSVGVFARVEIRLRRHTDQASLRHPVPFIGPEDFFVFSVTGNSSFDSHIGCDT